MTYEEACDWLNQHQFFTIKLGLETTGSLLAELGNPQETCSIIHIAGTNGKGSVGATLLSVLHAGGYRTGFYSSPHLSSVRERFRIGTTLISESEFTALIRRLADFLGDRPHPTYFELTTILALLWFAEQQAEVVILETGLGGRLDATNVVTPLLSIITDISRDHEQYLGTTIEAIAGEKAGIIKPGGAVVFSGREKNALPVIADRCRETDSPLLLFGRDFQGQAAQEGIRHIALDGASHHYPLQLQGEHQVINTSLALAALEWLAPALPLNDEQIRTGLRHVHWPGRMECVSLVYQGKQLRVLFDGAHNEAGVRQLCRSLTEGYPRKRLLLVWGNMTDKSIYSSLTTLAAHSDVLILTRVESERAAPPQTILAQLPLEVQTRTICLEPMEAAINRAQQMAEEDDLICVAGSLYLVGGIRSLLVAEAAA